MLDQTRDVLTHSRVTLIGDAVGVALLFSSLFLGLHFVF